ncbi:MAG: helix-turn-helix transcriptional regulator [Rickettsiales bacterium]
MHYSANLLRQLRLRIGNNIHHYRIRQKMPLRKLSCLSGVSENLLDCYELGKYEISLADLLKISCALKVDFNDLMLCK